MRRRGGSNVNSLFSPYAICGHSVLSKSGAPDALGVLRSCNAASIAETRSCPSEPVMPCQFTFSGPERGGLESLCRPNAARVRTHGEDLVAPVETSRKDVHDIVTLVLELAREDVAQEGEQRLLVAGNEHIGTDRQRSSCLATALQIQMSPNGRGLTSTA